jgi:N4-gp56 family major capsid protein
MTAIGTGIGIADLHTSTASNGGTTIAPEVMTYYEKVFLARKEYEFVLREGGQSRTHPANEGRTVNFTRYNPITINTNPLGEASNPVTCALNASTVAMTLSEYGITTVHGNLFTTFAIDSVMK